MKASESYWSSQNMINQDPGRKGAPEKWANISAPFSPSGICRYPGRGQLLRAEVPGKLSRISESWGDKNYSSGLPRQPRIEGSRSLRGERHGEGNPALFSPRSICPEPKVKNPSRKVLKTLTLEGHVSWLFGILIVKLNKQGFFVVVCIYNSFLKRIKRVPEFKFLITKLYGLGDLCIHLDFFSAFLFNCVFSRISMNPGVCLK